MMPAAHRITTRPSASHCRTTGKRRFSTHALATAELKRIAFQRRYLGRVYRMERAVYLCDHCDAWHLTSHARGAR